MWIGRRAFRGLEGVAMIAASSKGGSAGIRTQMNVLLGLGSMFPLAAGAVGIGMLTRSRRRGLDFFMTTWPRTLLAATGVRLNVLGAQNLTAQTPAVFLYNHRNQVDPFIASSLMGDNWIKVAKKEMARDPFIGTILKLTDTAFLDRGDTAAAMETLRQVEERAKNGTSVLIAPEGSREHATEVGAFKKGPFRIAMAAGIPIVPIVIRNAESVASRDSAMVSPGTVDIAVFPPIPVDAWTVDTLTDRIAEVRQLYLDTLAHWPTDVLPEAGLYAATASRDH